MNEPLLPPVAGCGKSQCGCRQKDETEVENLRRVLTQTDAATRARPAGSVTTLGSPLPEPQTP